MLAGCSEVSPYSGGRGASIARIRGAEMAAERLAGGSAVLAGAAAGIAARFHADSRRST